MKNKIVAGLLFAAAVVLAVKAFSGLSPVGGVEYASAAGNSAGSASSAAESGTQNHTEETEDSGNTTEPTVISALSQSASSCIGIDVSRYNGTVDWEQVKAAGYTFVMIKTGNGSEPANFSDDVDQRFEEYYTGAKAAGLKVGVYHACATRTPEGAKKDAAYCLAILNGRKLDYPVAYDMELDGTFAGGSENTTKIAEAFCKAVKAAGYTPMVYSTAKHLSTDFKSRIGSEYLIWAANYDVPSPQVPFTCALWQYSNTTAVQGTSNTRNRCDVDYSYLEAESISLSKETLTMGTGETFRLKASMKPSDTLDAAVWSSDHPEICKVTKSGKLTAVKAGTAVITAAGRYGSASAVCTVTVKAAPASMTIAPVIKTMKKGTSVKLTASADDGAAAAVTVWSSGNKAVASVSSTGLVKAKKAGTVKITAAFYNGVKKTVTIRVK